jgi:hypothetical protein
MSRSIAAAVSASAAASPRRVASSSESRNDGET